MAKEDDVSPENVVKLQNDGYKPAPIIESSSRNFQCILTISVKLFLYIIEYMINTYINGLRA